MVFDGKGIRAMLLNTQMEVGGAQKMVFQLAKGLERKGYQVTICTLYDRGYREFFQRREGLEIVDLDMKRDDERFGPRRVARFLKGVWLLYRLLRIHRIDLLQTYCYYANLIGSVTAHLAGVPVVVASQRESLPHKGRAYHLVDRWVCNSALVDKVVAVSEGTRRFCIEQEGMRSKKVITIRNGIDLADYDPYMLPPAEREQLRAELGLQGAGRIVGTVASLQVKKGHSYLLEAIPLVLSEFPDAYFLLAGEGPEKGSLHAMTRRLRIEDRVRFLGVRHDVSRILALIDLFVLPSLWEGLPNAVLEAMAMQKPVVATMVDGNTEAVVAGETGLLVSPRDAIALADAIRELLRDSEMARNMGVAGRKRIEQEFGLSRIIGEYDMLYRRILGQKIG
jgi:glycosyltransferase involved in cell wall biosynthesis